MNKSNMRSGLLFRALTLILAATMLISCINAVAEEKTPSWKLDISPFEFDLYFYASWGTGYPWRGSLVEQYITEDTGVKPNIIIPTGNEKE